DGEVFAELDACNEDPFTLERFHTLITLHAEKHKDFIIARVATKDGGSSPDREETRNEKYYYSYYTAHHINKVLFRTQPDEGLLHRMRAKNPLNNLTIVGDVHYFVIEWEHAQSVLAEHRRLTAPVANTMQTFAQASMDTFATLMNSLSTTLGVSRSAPTRRRSDPSIPVQSLTRSNRKDQPVLLQLYMQPEALEAGFPPLTASTFTAKYYASDDDFLMHASVRTYFRANALESDDAVLFTIPSSSQD
ncbi:hypothetical protein BJ742DRAFT_653000, partial [Cladochytrium replicatum]